MPRYAIFLRGVTPTGRNKVPMAPLRDALEAEGLRDVATLIQSGNAVATTRLSRPALERLVHDVVARQFGGDLPVVAIAAGDLRRMLDAVPFEGVNPAELYLTFPAAEPAAPLVAALPPADAHPGRFSVGEGVVYHHCPTPYGKSKVNNGWFERKLKVPCTTRVVRTVERTLELAERGA